ncbi:hypothetical protein [Xylanimonas oleitrophica]|uniref:hypothetical protein n=1 Tax=Xylanimonas oleitrophica TaxID=2607479 RepID=UPI0015D0A53F|nr:hypothetical protein [Xylanimonas oleitrophica]
MTSVFQPLTVADYQRRIAVAMLALTANDNPELARIRAIEALMGTTCDDRMSLS